MAELIDHASRASDKREKYRQLREMARKRAIDVVLVWKYDRSRGRRRSL